ncbi:hypothetical protein [Runella limosa]|uniref:hypothetical protein n=1 Tax=Runella limosa TaxID=370978 RepID=UPI0004190513|nr:hypothetical protein [Runella limosa]
MLFRTIPEDETPTPIVAKSSAIVEKFYDFYVKSTVRDKIEDIFPTLETGQNIEYVSMADWSTHELVFWVLAQIGPAEMTMATWSMTETAARQLVEARLAGVLTSVHCLFDYRIKVRYPEVCAYVKEHFEAVTVAHCHAKVTVLENDQWAVVINASSNYTNNVRIESGSIKVSHQTANFHKNWIIPTIEGHGDYAKRT